MAMSAPACDFVRQGFFVSWPRRIGKKGDCMPEQRGMSSGVGSTDLLRRPTRKGRTALSKPAIAELTSAEIDEMTSSELVNVVRAARLASLAPWPDPELHEYDREKLVRLVHLARRCCRQQGY